MSDENMRKLIAAATREAFRDAVTEAGRKYLDAAEAAAQKGDVETANDMYRKAAEAFIETAEKFRASKSFKNAAINMCAAGDVYSELADAPRAIEAYRQAAEDLFGASAEHLMWGEDSEVRKATALAMAACMVLIMVGNEDEAFRRARQFVAENSSKIRYPADVRVSQIPQMLESAVQNVDIGAFADAENAAVTELKSALVNAGAEEFVKYVDRGLDMMREILRGKVRLPKISAMLDLPVDMTFKEDVTLRAQVRNVGEGEAMALRAEWFVDPGLKVVSGERSHAPAKLGPGDVVSMGLTVRAAKDMAGVKEYSIMVRGTYADLLNTEYSFQAGPGTLVLKDYKESEKLAHDIDVTESRIGLLRSSVELSELQKEPLTRIVDTLATALARARDDVGEKRLEQAKSRLQVINEIVDSVDAIVGDEELLARTRRLAEQARKEFARQVLLGVRDAVFAAIEKGTGSAQALGEQDLQEWDREASQRRGLASSLSQLRERLGEVVSQLDQVYAQLPPAATTDDPQVAAARTRVRTAVESILSGLKGVRSELSSAAASPVLDPGTRPQTSPTSERVATVLSSLRSEVESVIERALGQL